MHSVIISPLKVSEFSPGARLASPPAAWTSEQASTFRLALSADTRLPFLLLLFSLGIPVWEVPPLVWGSLWHPVSLLSFHQPAARLLKVNLPSGRASAQRRPARLSWSSFEVPQVLRPWDPVKASFQPNPKAFSQNTESSSSYQPEKSGSCSVSAGDVWSCSPADKTRGKICADQVFKHWLKLSPRFVPPAWGLKWDFKINVSRDVGFSWQFVHFV